MEKPTGRSLARHLTVSLRTLLVLVLVFGGWLGWIVRGVRIQREAVAALEKARFRVLYDWEWKAGSRDWQGKPWAPKWLVDYLGADYFGRVASVSHWGWINHSGSSVDADLTHVGRLTGLTDLTLISSSISNNGLSYLKGLTQLEHLTLDGIRVTDAGLVHLRGMSSLRTLDLQDTKVTEDGVRKLQKALPNLKVHR